MQALYNKWKLGVGIGVGVGVPILIALTWLGAWLVMRRRRAPVKQSLDHK